LDVGRVVGVEEGTDDDSLELEEQKVVVLVDLIGIVVVVVESGRDAVHVAVEVNLVVLNTRQARACF
jgi:hypothetical protein